MSENAKQIRARVQHKHKTEAQWILDVYDELGNLRDKPFIPLAGELIIFDTEDESSSLEYTGRLRPIQYPRFKFGDGKTNVMALPFVCRQSFMYGGKIRLKWQDNPVQFITLSDEFKAYTGIEYVYEFWDNENKEALMRINGDGTENDIQPIPEQFYFVIDSESEDYTTTFCGYELKGGDWLAVVDGRWQKIDNTDTVTSVNGQVGDVVINAEKDWNQNDPQASDYIKNRTHYITFGEPYVWTDFQINDGQPAYDLPFVDGRTDAEGHYVEQWLKPGKYVLRCATMDMEWEETIFTEVIASNKTSIFGDTITVGGSDGLWITPTDNYGVIISLTYYELAGLKQLDAAFIPVDNNTIKVNSSGNLIATVQDTKNTTGALNTSNKIYLVGATSQTTNPITYTHDTAYVGADGCLYSGKKKVLVQDGNNFSLSSQGYPQIGYNAYVDTDADDSIAIGCEAAVISGVAVASVAIGHGALVDAVEDQVAIGVYNTGNSDGVLVVGNGTSDDDRNDALIVQRNGDLWVAGKITANKPPIDDNDVVTKKYVDALNTDALIYKETNTTETINLTMPLGYLEVPVLCYGDGTLLLLGHDMGESRVYRSIDEGQSWSYVDNHGLWSGSLSRFIYGNGMFVGLLYPDSGIICSSDGGLNWTKKSLPTNDMWTEWQYFAYTDGVFMLADTDMYVAVSSNLEDWTIKSGTYLTGLVGGNGKFVGIDGTGTAYIYDKAGNTLSQHYVGMDPSESIYFFNDSFVVKGNRYDEQHNLQCDTIAISTDGENWETFSVAEQRGMGIPFYLNGDYFLYQGEAGNYYVSKMQTNGELATPVSMGSIYPLFPFINCKDYAITSFYDDNTSEQKLFGSADGFTWSTTITIENEHVYLEQAGIDVTSKVTKLVGGGVSIDSFDSTYFVQSGDKITLNLNALLEREW